MKDAKDNTKDNTFTTLLKKGAIYDKCLCIECFSRELNKKSGIDVRRILMDHWLDNLDRGVWDVIYEELRILEFIATDGRNHMFVDPSIIGVKNIE